MTTPYEGNLSLREARDRYFADNHFGADGGYASSWVELHLGPLPVPFPNTPARKAVVPIHDLHHLVTGYGTDWSGEAEIGAWEIGAGCGKAVVAWQLNLSVMVVGGFIAPRRTFRAFVRGRRSRSFYGQRWEPLLGLSVAEAAQVLGTTVAAVKLRAHRAYEALRAALAEMAGPDSTKRGHA